jgi:hypothetical protein
MGVITAYCGILTEISKISSPWYEALGVASHIGVGGELHASRVGNELSALLKASPSYPLTLNPQDAGAFLGPVLPV